MTKKVKLVLVIDSEVSDEFLRGFDLEGLDSDSVEDGLKEMFVAGELEYTEIESFAEEGTATLMVDVTDNE